MVLKNFLVRPMSYRVGAVVALCSSLFLVLGVACPYWYQSGDGTNYGGLWSLCDSDKGTCTSLTADVAEGWWISLQVLEPLAIFCVSLSCSCLFFENYFNDVNAPTLMQELLGLAGGLLGLTGCLIFVGKTESSAEDIYTTYSWSFYFAILGSVIVFIASIVILIGGKTAGKSLSTHHPDGHVSPEPVRRFSLLWARLSPSSPVGARKQMGSAASHDFTSLPAPGTQPTSSRLDNRRGTSTISFENEEDLEQPRPESTHF